MKSSNIFSGAMRLLILLELAPELADVLLYLLQLASLNNIDLGQAVLDKLKINDGRKWDT